MCTNKTVRCLPDEVLLFILAHLSARDLRHVVSVNRHFRKVGEDPRLWSRTPVNRHMLTRYWGVAEMRRITRFRLVRSFDLSHFFSGKEADKRLRHFVKNIAKLKLQSLNLSHNNLVNVPRKVLSRLSRGSAKLYLGFTNLMAYNDIYIIIKSIEEFRKNVTH